MRKIWRIITTNLNRGYSIQIRHYSSGLPTLIQQQPFKPLLKVVLSGLGEGNVLVDVIVDVDGAPVKPAEDSR